jgi:DNA modification methylase
VKPYYEHAGITIYHGDCREVLQHVSADVLVTDPPYGIAYKPLRGSNGSKMWGSETVAGDDVPFDPEPLLALGLPSILWGANHYASRLPDSGGWLVWDKTPSGIREGFIYSHAELAWTSATARVHKFSLNWQGADRAGELFWHPTQKAVTLMEWCLGFVPDGTVLDPFMGSGTTLVAAKNLGRKAIGIEIEERYCEIAAKRLAQEVLPL